MGLSCCGRTGGPHGRVSTEVGRLTRFHREFKRNVVQELLKGERPWRRSRASSTSSPVCELVINLKTAKALGLTIPQSLLLRADRVIQ
jgi:hypothetical protein